MREPSIHITRTALNALLEEYEYRHELGIDIDSLVEYLLYNGSYYQIEKRLPLASFKKDVKKVLEGTMAPKDETSLMAQTIHMLRWKDNKFKAGALVKDGDAAWKKTKEIAALGNRFCEAYDLRKDIGYKKYIGIYMMIKTKSFSLQAINARHEFICETYEAQLKIEDDDHREDTARAHEEYQRRVFERTGNKMDYHNNPVQYAHFIDAIDQANELNLTAEDYIESQFQQLDWKNGIPKPAGFATDMARDRAITWMAETEHTGADEDQALNELRKVLREAREADEDND